MDSDDVINSYVHDVARQLPPRRRHDVALELHALLGDDLADRARREGRPADAEMAVDLVRAFGRPAEIATRYHRPFTLIEPYDTWSFVVAAAVGVAVISLVASPTPSSPDKQLAERSSELSLAWIGLLAVAYSAKNLIRRHRPESFPWKPRPVRDPHAARRLPNVALALLFAVLIALYLFPGAIVERVSGGRVPAGELAYSESFLHPLRWPWLVGILALVALLHLVIAVRGRWTRHLRLAQLALLLTCVSQLGWHMRYGTVFAAADVEQVVFPIIDAVNGMILVAAAVIAYREWNRVRPAPAAGVTGA